MARPQSYRLIGIDFGTTYSGVGWAWSERFDDSGGIIEEWDGIGGRERRAKVPSKIMYENGIATKWGYGVPAGAKCMRWFKLLLLEEVDLPADVRESEYIKEARQMLQQLGKRAVDVVADYLRFLWEHVIKEMKIREGNAAVEGSPFWVVITIPAIWRPYAQSRMEQAASAAGIVATRLAGKTKLSFCAEPEAAALAVMDDDDGHTILPRDMFVVCDVGGGTVDLITYELQDSTERKMGECAKGAGKMCGAILVDKAFEEKVRTWVNPKKWKKIPDTRKREWQEEAWEGDRGLKRRFDGEERDWRLGLPWEYFAKSGAKFKLFSGKTEKRPIKDHELVLKRMDLAAVFDPAMEQTIALVEDQIEQTKRKKGRLPKAVFLVGGFGQSPYLHHRLTEKFKGLGIEIRKPSQDYSWSAICRGALLRAAILHAHEGSGLLRGLPNLGTRVSRMSYGIAYFEPFDPRRHLEADKLFLPSVNQWCALNQMFWYLKANDDIADQAVRRYDWRRTMKSAPLNNQFSLLLLKCEDDNPPNRQTDNMKVECEIVCKVSTPFEQLPVSNVHEGETWRQVNFDLELRSHGTALEWAAYYNGIRQPPVVIYPPYSVEADGSAVQVLALPSP